MSNPEYHKFVTLLYEAHAASEAVDDFDLHSDDADEMAFWQWLRNEQHKMFHELIQHLEAHASDIKAGMGEPPTDVPAEPPAHLLRKSDARGTRFARVVPRKP